MRRFKVVREKDVTGVSGVGVVADGVEFDDGAVVIRWRGDHKSTVIWDCLNDALMVHGHHGATWVEWVDL